MKFKDFLRENKEIHHVFTFMRANPVTTGHQLVVNKVKDVAKEHGATHSIVLSHTQDKNKNPLSTSDKLKHAKRFFPKTNLSTSSKESPTFFSHAEKLYKQGVTHLHMVAGSDRVEKYKKELAHYNGKGEGKLYNFKKITVHNAGERDPDAEGTTGMSASKMRAHAKSGNFKEFKKGVPSHVPEHHAKEMFHDVRKGMNIEESIDDDFQSLLTEGVHDKAIFKAVFLAGGPGSGKDYVMNNTLAGHGLTEINSDKALEFLMDKKGLDKTMPASEEEKRNLVRGRAKGMTDLRQQLAIKGRNGLIINGTGDDPEKIARIKKSLEEIGYDTSMILVNTDDEVSKQRNVERGQRGGRTVPENIRKAKWDGVQAARPEFAKLFGSTYTEFDNSEDLREAPPEVVKQKKDEMLEIYRDVQNFVAQEPKSPIAQQWIAMELNSKNRMPVSKTGVEKHPHKDSGSAEDANKLGLDYYGFGRYGKDGKVTHHSVNGKLVEIPKSQPKQPRIPTSSSSGVKKVNEEFEDFLNESVSVTITGDTPQEISSVLKLLTNDIDEKVEEENETTFSDNTSMKALTLGYGMIKESNDDFTKNLLKDKNGKVRTFVLRTAAAREAHTHDGVVYKSDKGYVVKLKESNRDQVDKRTIQEKRTTPNGSVPRRDSSTTSHDSSCSCSRCTGRTERKTVSEKITFTQIREKQEKLKESIDKGIEPGMALNSYAKDTLNKKGKITVSELTGDETTASIGDQKELELKRKGIDLKTFKSKKFVG